MYKDVYSCAIYYRQKLERVQMPNSEGKLWYINATEYFIAIKNDKYENYVEIKRMQYKAMSKTCRTQNDTYTMITTM